jgi:hypothetical protein
MVSYEHIKIDTVLTLINFLFAFWFFFTFLPSKVIQFDDDHNKFLDKFFISFVHFNFITILLVHFLAFFKLYETISLIFCYIACAVLIKNYYGTSGNRFQNIKSLGIEIYDLLDNLDAFRSRVKEMMNSCTNAMFRSIRLNIKKLFLNPFGGILILPVLAFAAYIRFYHSMTKLYFGASDCYVHLEWIKYLGSNDLYKGKIYPNGYHAVISALNKLSFIDPYYILRFMGPLEGVLIVLSLYYAMSRIYRNHRIMAWTAMLIYALGLNLPVDVFRQISALPQEYTAILLLPGMYYFYIFTASGRKKFLVLAGECFCISVLTHPYITVFLALGYLTIFIVNSKRVFQNGLLSSIIITGAISTLIGILPLLIGYLLGHSFHGSLGYIQDSVKLPTDSGITLTKEPFNESNITLQFFLLSIVILVILCLMNLYGKNKKDRFDYIKPDFIILSTAILLYVLYRAPELDLPVVMDINRIGIFLSLFAAAIFALVFTYACRFFKDKYILTTVNVVACIITLGLVLPNSSYTPPKGARYEYNEAVYGYLKVKSDSFPLSWIIISPVEQYSQAISYGWHYELSQFIYEIEDPDKRKLEMEGIVYIFVEKYPLDSKIEVNEEYTKEYLPKELINSNKIYSDPETRLILQSKAYYWAEAYMKNHDNVEKIFDNENMNIYKITQVGKEPIDFKKE